MNSQSHCEALGQQELMDGGWNNEQEESHFPGGCKEPWAGLSGHCQPGCDIITTAKGEGRDLCSAGLGGAARALGVGCFSTGCGAGAAATAA